MLTRARVFSGNFDATVKLHARNHSRLVRAARKRDSEQTRQELREAVEKAVSEAVRICRDNEWYPCAVAWDVVDELSAAEAKAAEARDEDPLEDYHDNSDSEE